VVLQGLRPVLAGIGLGLVGSLAFATLAGRLVPGMSGVEAPPFVAASLLLGLVAAVAADLPARRAASRSPIEGLRGE
jgi:ABC-type antimicrobial peptide transport system permease subunit